MKKVGSDLPAPPGNFERLPKEIFAKILKYIENLRDISRLEAVSKCMKDYAVAFAWDNVEELKIETRSEVSFDFNGFKITPEKFADVPSFALVPRIFQKLKKL